MSLDSQETFALLGTIVAIVFGAAYAYGRAFDKRTLTRLIVIVITGYAVGQILLQLFLWLNHISFPLNLEAMELTVLQHVRRVLNGQLIYVDPSFDFVPLVYSPIYYVLAVPFTWLFGPSLFAVRFVSILGVLGAGLVIFLAVRGETGSNWWGLIALGLFSAAYRAMDAYLDTAHADSWTLFMILLGCYLIAQNRSRARNLMGLSLIVTAFWFKQYGAIFAIGGVLFLTWREGWRNAWPYWVLATALGPALYFAAPAWLFGPRLHYYTLEVPRQWVQFDANFTVVRVIKYTVKHYLWLAAFGGIFTLAILFRSFNRLSIWNFILPIAVLSGFYVALDPANNKNVFIPMGVWFIVTGVFGLKFLTDRLPALERWGGHVFVICASFALLIYNPATLIISNQAPTAYQDLVRYLKSLDGPVYAPWLGQLADGYEFYPAAHWVPMTDLYRGPNVNYNDHPVTRALLEPVLNPRVEAYILLSGRLENDAALKFLADRYTLHVDFGERFASLSTLPRTINIRWPRFLYRYSLEESNNTGSFKP